MGVTQLFALFMKWFYHSFIVHEKGHWLYDKANKRLFSYIFFNSNWVPCMRDVWK
jgi:hypothetical protein